MRIDVMSKSEVIVCLPGHGVGGYCWGVADVKAVTPKSEDALPCTIELLPEPDVTYREGDPIGGGTSARFYIVGAPNVIYSVTFSLVRAWNKEEAQSITLDLTFGG